MFLEAFDLFSALSLCSQILANNLSYKITLELILSVYSVFITFSKKIANFALLNDKENLDMHIPLLELWNQLTDLVISIVYPVVVHA